MTYCFWQITTTKFYDMRATKINHKNEDRIKIDIPYNQAMITKLRQIPDAGWSQTYWAWHIRFRPDKKPFGQFGYFLTKNANY